MRDDFKSEKGMGGGGGGRGMPPLLTVAAGVEVIDGGSRSFSEKQSTHEGLLKKLHQEIILRNLSPI